MNAVGGLWRAITAIGMASISATLLAGVGTAQAHPDDPHETDVQHAAQDLAGVPIGKIEKDTRANAVKIKKATGAVPGRRTTSQRVANDRMSIEASADPGQGGQWSAVQSTPVVPVFQAVLPARYRSRSTRTCTGSVTFAARRALSSRSPSNSRKAFPHDAGGTRLAARQARRGLANSGSLAYNKALKPIARPLASRRLNSVSEVQAKSQPTLVLSSPLQVIFRPQGEK